MSPTKTALTPAAIRKLAAREYAREAKTGTGPFYPAEAKRRIAKATGLSTSRLASLVDPLYFAENGLRAPLDPPKGKTDGARLVSLAKAIRRRRDGGGTLGRWESVAASASAAIGRPVSERAARALYAKGGGTLATSYVGRGTRIAAPATRADEAVEVRA